MLAKMNRSTLLFFGGAILVYVVVQFLISSGSAGFYATILLQAGVLAIVGIGLNLIYGFNGQFSLGQWGFYAIGAYASADITYRWTSDKSAVGLTVLLLAVTFSGFAILLLRRYLGKVRGLDQLSAFTIYLLAAGLLSYLGLVIGRAVAPAVTALLLALPEAVNVQVVFVLSVLVAGVLAAEISFLFGLPVLTLNSDYFGIATLGFTIIVKVLLDNSDTLLGFEEMKGARGMVGIPKVTSWFWVFLFVLIAIILVRNLLHSSYGRAVVSVREDEIAARAMGINVADYKILSFVIGSLLAGVAGGLYAHINGFLHPNTFNFIQSFNPLIIIVFGGLGSISGTVVAAFAWQIVLEGLLRQYLPQGFETWRYVVYPLLLLLMMLLKPSGLFGTFEFPFLRQITPALKKTTAEAQPAVKPAG
jgi:branched-chain amino acid transport system permease protein